MAGKIGKKGSTKKRKRRIASFFINFSITKKTRKWLWILSGIGIIFVIIANIFEEYSLGFVLSLVTGIILTTGGLGVLTVNSEKKLTRNTIIHLLVLFLGIFFKRMHWPGAGIIISLTLLTWTFGYLFLGIKNLYAVKKNKYFRLVGSGAAFFIALMSTGMVFKFMHWPGGGYLVAISLIPSIIFTLIVLVTLPGSGYILWEKKFKQVFIGKLLIPWIFFLLFAASTFLLPQDISRQVLSADASKENPFDMHPYEIEQMEGMEPDQ